jgi:hypothetical protein
LPEQIVRIAKKFEKKRKNRNSWIKNDDGGNNLEK